MVLSKNLLDISNIFLLWAVWVKVEDIRTTGTVEYLHALTLSPLKTNLYYAAICIKIQFSLNPKWDRYLQHPDSHQSFLIKYYRRNSNLMSGEFSFTFGYLLFL